MPAINQSAIQMVKAKGQDAGALYVAGQVVWEHPHELTTYSTVGTRSITAPSWATAVIVVLYGGGGGGQAGNSGNGQSGVPGKAGVGTAQLFALPYPTGTPVLRYEVEVTVGGGGAGGSASHESGLNGAASIATVRRVTTSGTTTINTLQALGGVAGPASGLAQGATSASAPNVTVPKVGEVVAGGGGVGKETVGGFPGGGGGYGGGGFFGARGSGAAGGSGLARIYFVGLPT